LAPSIKSAILFEAGDIQVSRMLLLNIFGAAAANRASGYCQTPADQFGETSPQIEEKNGNKGRWVVLTTQ
jgi:hypothetical protein